MKNLIQSILLVMAFFIMEVHTAAQVNLEWTVKYSNGPLDINAMPVDMVIDDDGYAYVTGSSYSDTTSEDIVVIKYDPSGNEVWVRRYNSTDTATDRPTALFVDQQGNVYVTGTSPFPNLVTLKYSSTGILEWANHIYTEPMWSRGYDIAADQLGNVYVTGLYDNNYFLTIKYDPQGNEVWSAVDSTNMGAYAGFLKLDPQGNAFVLHRAMGWSCKTIKYNTAGTKEWEQNYFGSGTGAIPAGLELDNSGNVIVAAGSGHGGDIGEYAIIKYNTSGGLIWSKVYDLDTSRNNFDLITGVVVDTVDNIYLTGKINYGHCYSDGYGTIKLNQSGTLKWERRHQPETCFYDGSNDMIMDKDGFIYVTGESSGGSGKQEILTFKYDQEGNLIWQKAFEEENEVGLKIAVHSNNDIYILGRQRLNDKYNFMLLKYSQWPVGIADSEDRTKIKLYPNPTTGSLIIISDNNKNEVFKITVTDITGKVIFSSADILEREYYLEISEPAGIYFMTLRSTEGAIIKNFKIVKQ